MQTNKIGDLKVYRNKITQTNNLFNKKKKRSKQVSTPNITINSTCLLSGILAEDNDGTKFAHVHEYVSDSYQDVDDVGVSVFEETNPG